MSCCWSVPSWFLGIISLLVHKWNIMTWKLLMLLIEGKWRHSWQWTQKNTLCQALFLLTHTDFVDIFLVFRKGIPYLITTFLITDIKFSITNNYFRYSRKPLAWSVKYFWSIYFFSIPLIRTNFHFQWWTGKCQCWALNKALRNFWKIWGCQDWNTSQHYFYSWSYSGLRYCYK